MCQKLLAAGGKLDVIDTFDGSDESGMTQAHSLLRDDSDYILTTFQQNISPFSNVDFGIFRGRSQQILPTMASSAVPLYDFIYIDASHRADDTFVDAYYCHRLLRPGGVLIFDDYLWKDPARPRLGDAPKAGIDFFMRLYGHLYALAHCGSPAQEYQKILIKLPLKKT